MEQQHVRGGHWNYSLEQRRILNKNKESVKWIQVSCTTSQTVSHDVLVKLSVWACTSAFSRWPHSSLDVKPPLCVQETDVRSRKKKKAWPRSSLTSAPLGFQMRADGRWRPCVTEPGPSEPSGRVKVHRRSHGGHRGRRHHFYQGTFSQHVSQSAPDWLVSTMRTFTRALCYINLD